MNYFCSSEAVSMGHPDKLCDLIADTILDAALNNDVYSSVNVECLITYENLLLSGSLSTDHVRTNAHQITYDLLKKLGYKDKVAYFNYKSATYHNKIKPFASVLYQPYSIEKSKDTGSVYGYAVSETPELLPVSQVLASKIMQAYDHARKTDKDCLLGPDANCLVTVEYENNKLKAINSIRINAQHAQIDELFEIREYVRTKILSRVLLKMNIFNEPKVYLNKTDEFVVGGPAASTGLTGRKLLYDTYGGYVPQASAMSGKDPNYTARSGTYLARFIAKHIVWAGLADKCQVELTYVKDHTDPISFSLTTFGTAIIEDAIIKKTIEESLDMSLSGIIARFGLKRKDDYSRSIQFADTAKYGHFMNQSFPWEAKNELFLKKIKRKCIDIKNTAIA